MYVVCKYAASPDDIDRYNVAYKQVSPSNGTIGWMLVFVDGAWHVQVPQTNCMPQPIMMTVCGKMDNIPTAPMLVHG